MAPTKHRIVRLADEHWGDLIEKFRDTVPEDRRPAHARPDTDWQVTEGLRMIADGTIKLKLIASKANQDKEPQKTS